MIRDMDRIYLDHNATTPVDSRVLQAMLPYLQGTFGNPSSIHTFGQDARRGLDRAREQVGAFLSADPREVVFTSGGTEADNLAIRGVVGEALRKGRRPVHILCSAIEHPAVLTTCERLARETGGPIRFERIPVDGNGVVRLDAFEKAIRPETVLVSIMHANNEIGTIQPVTEIGRTCRAKGVLFHCDAVQSAGKIPVDVRGLGADLVALSAHKIYGPKGVGALWIRKGVRLDPMQTGGHQEREIRTGTENLAGIVALARACEIAASELGTRSETVLRQRDQFEEAVRQRIPRTRVNGGGAPRVPNTTNLSFDGLEGEAIVLGLDLEGIACSTGSACTSGSVEPSHVLTALGVPTPLALGAVRFSLGRSTTEAQIDRTVEALEKVVARLRRVAPVLATAGGRDGGARH